MLLLILLTTCHVVLAQNNIYYETLYGKTLTSREYYQYVKLNLTYWCTGVYKPCNPREGRRTDSTCNNLRYPNRGNPHTPYSFDLPPIFGEGIEPRKTKSGKQPAPARKDRMATLTDGDIPDNIFTTLVPHFSLFKGQGLASNHDSINYIRWKNYCCQPKGKKDPECYPMEVPADDAVHQFSNVRCMNMTRPYTYQSVGCTRDKYSTPVRINSVSHFMDLSIIYQFDNSLRAMKDGLLKYEEENGKIWPPSTDKETAMSYCLQNRLPEETRCHKILSLNALFGSNFFGIIIWRFHNYLARRLMEINPCWNDEKLFTTAKEMNIAIVTQIFYYELMSAFLGKENLLKERVLVPDGGFRNEYRADLVPMVSTEFIYAQRWFHTVMPGFAKLMDNNGKEIDKIAFVDLIVRTGFIGAGNNMEMLTQGAFRQPMGRIDHIVDPHMSQKGFSRVQEAFDIPAADLLKGGLFGIQPYIRYRKMCTGKEYTSFEDLIHTGDIDPEYVKILQDIYEDVEDIPLLVGIWLENKILGGHAPRTLYCLFVKQLKKFPQYDRFWYESSTRPGAFSKKQLDQIRKSSMAWIFCAVGDSVTHIQPNPFLLEAPGNVLTSCENIPKVDLRPWRDETCNGKQKNQNRRVG